MSKLRGKCDNKEGDLNYTHPFPRILGYVGSDITKGDTTKLKVYYFGLRRLNLKDPMEICLRSRV